MRAVKIFKALSDQNRVRAIMSLKERELCVCQIVELLGLASSTVSKHMSLLADAGLVESEKRGRWVYYRPASNGDHQTKETLAMLPRLLDGENQLAKDNESLKSILELDPETLCRIQSERT